MPKMIVDKSELVGENAWAKLLPDEKDKAIIVKMNKSSSNNNDSKETTPLNVDLVLEN